MPELCPLYNRSGRDQPESSGTFHASSYCRGLPSPCETAQRQQSVWRGSKRERSERREREQRERSVVQTVCRAAYIYRVGRDYFFERESERERDNSVVQGVYGAERNFTEPSVLFSHTLPHLGNLGSRAALVYRSSMFFDASFGAPRGCCSRWSERRGSALALAQQILTYVCDAGILFFLLETCAHLRPERCACRPRGWAPRPRATVT